MLPDHIDADRDLKRVAHRWHLQDSLPVFARNTDGSIRPISASSINVGDFVDVAASFDIFVHKSGRFAVHLNMERIIQLKPAPRRSVPDPEVSFCLSEMLPLLTDT